MADHNPTIHNTSDRAESQDNSQTFGLSYVLPPLSPLDANPSASIATERKPPSPAAGVDDDGAEAREGTATQDPSAKARKRVTIQPPTTNIAEGLLSPDLSNPLLPHNSSAEQTPDLKRDRFSPDIGTYEDFQQNYFGNQRQSRASFNDYQAYLQSSDTERLRGAPSIKSAYENDFHPVHECPTSRDFYQSRFTCLNLTVIVICIFSCIFSAIFLILALKAPRYGRRITSQGSFKPSDAILLTTIMAKLVELSFVTSFVAFLGQVLSRRAFMKEDDRGVTLSELSMWRWVVQPGTLVTHWEAAKYAGLTLLGILSLLSTILATFYSSAATALVQPMLKDGNWDKMVLSAQVKTVFANVDYIKHMCQTPIRNDKGTSGSTCLQIEHAGQGFHNYHRYLAFWDMVASFENGTTDQLNRQPGFGLLYENTTITGQWINIINTPANSKQFGRVINNVTLAMPHAGVFAAARDKRNDILQPEELNSEGTYSLRASVPSPAINVLCANMNREELKPIVYDEWNNELVNITTWSTLAANATTTNKTKVDDIFGWDSDDRLDYPPVFARLPNPFNTIMNHTSFPWGRDAIYLLGQGGPADNGVNMTGTYVLCKLHMEITPECATQHNVTGSGGTMEALCEDRSKDMPFIKDHPDARLVESVANWRDIGTDWSNSLSLNTGIMDGDASNSRLLMQLMLNPTNPDPKNLAVDLNPALPSVAEALAVMSGCTLLKAMLDAPFVMAWNHTNATLDNFETQYFNATLRAQQYASSGIKSSAKGWIVILLLVFLMNIFVLMYFIFHRGLVTDFSEPPNLFALAVNSPPSYAFAGSCGGGPEGAQYSVNWFVKNEGEHIFIEPGGKIGLLGRMTRRKNHNGDTVDDEAISVPHQAKPGYFASLTNSLKRNWGSKDAHPPTKLAPASAVEGLRAPSLRTMSMATSEYEMDDAVSVQSSRTQRQFAKLANRRSRL